ncbi:MAG: hypothetical protein N5P05_004245 (plasmid) [Chroococcopsis gigantea SAG 12.99]|jgi:hypothetical protein|nr:hypothetical protein [Chroococcopsis gigantea SAG 12.99]
MNLQDNDSGDNPPHSYDLDTFSPRQTKEKIRAILAAASDYLRLEDLTEAKVEAVKDNEPQIWEENVKLLGNQLIIPKKLFDALKAKVKSCKQNNRPEDFQIAVAFPRIVQIEGNIEKFRPLFTIDISSIFSGNHLGKGWDLTKFEFHPILLNLMELYGLDEEEVNSLVTRQGLFPFLKNTFNRPVETLQDWVELIELPSKPLRSSHSPYLLRFDLSFYRFNLKEDFRQMSDQEDLTWAVPGHPAYQYLFGMPEEPDKKQTFLGAFPVAPPDEDQALALKHARTNSLTAVMGPPGSGKTHNIAHKISQVVVDRAVKIVTGREDESNLTLITSTNNKAVNNIESLLAGNPKLSNLFYISGGSKDLVESQVLPKLAAAIDRLDKQTFNRNQWESTKERLGAKVKEFNSCQKQDEIARRQRPLDERRLSECTLKIQNLRAEIELQDQELARSSPPGSQNYKEYPLQVIERISRQFERAWSKLPPNDETTPRTWVERVKNWGISLWRWFKGKNEGALISELNRNISPDVSLIRETPYPLELILDRKHLEELRSRVSRDLSKAYEWWEYQRNQDKLRDRLTTYQEQLAASQHERRQIEHRLSTHPERDFPDRFYTELHSLQVELFELSWEFLQQEALRRKTEVITSLTNYIGVLNKDWNSRRRFKEEWRKTYRNVSLLFPVFLSTLHSLRRLFPELKEGCIDQLIVDEAGQILPHLPIPALVRSRRAMFFGDPLQIEPVVVISDDDKERHRVRAYSQQGLTDADFDRFGPIFSSAYLRAAGSTCQDGALGNGIILKSHYRCIPLIANFCNILCYANQMVIKTNPKPSLLGPNLIAIDVKGEVSSQINAAEIDRIEALIEVLLVAGYGLDSPENHNTIGVISPYRSQANALTHRLQSRWNNFPIDSLGTVHTFQGGQKSVIILSTRQSQPHEGLWFLNCAPNLLNVAVSRARELFILVGNLDHLSQGTYSKRLVDYIKEFGEIRNR